uniref:Uncharacterized protein n=1 Tax=Seriola dumerili TaxID=41447 RepID=A0A3B4V935_SERDU
RGLPHRPLQSKLYAVPLAVLKQSDEKPEKVELSQRPRVPRVVQAYRGEAVTFVSCCGPHRSTEALRSLPVSLRSCQYYELQLTYNNLKSEEVRGPVLPPGQDTDIFTATNLSVASTVGQVIIGQNPPRITCVVNKTNIIDSTYRNFKMEVLAGEENMVTKVSYTCERKWEHQRVWSSSNVVDTVLDVCCGVGPFAIRCWPARVPMCWPNDSEPRSYRWLQHNCSCRQGGEQSPKKPMFTSVMEPACLALEFLDAFRGSSSPPARVPPGDRCSVHFVFILFVHLQTFLLCYPQSPAEEPAPKRQKCEETYRFNIIKSSQETFETLFFLMRKYEFNCCICYRCQNILSSETITQLWFNTLSPLCSYQHVLELLLLRLEMLMS